MLSSYANNVKIYNLSAGKSLPEWLSDRKRRIALKKNIELRRRIELIQDFDMPGVSSCVKMSKDGQYVLATGVYKPRVRCYDVNNLSMKFERCFDSEVVAFDIISDDYSKLIFLQCDRYVEIHAQHGRYYRMRIPKFGRDLKFHYQSCDVLIAGSGSDVYRLNLEQGRFLQPYMTDASSINAVDINDYHQLLLFGTAEGRVEAWDPRSRTRTGILDCAFASVNSDIKMEGVPAVTSIKSRDAMHFAVGTSTGQILLYDIRSHQPLLVKDHMYGRPIKNINFHPSGGHDLVVTMDSQVVRFWDRNTGKPYTSIETQSEFNDLCMVPNTGLMFMAQEDKKMLAYYAPSLGPAPRWCSFLDSLTEELEENATSIIYDDYKFVTPADVENLGLSHLIGTNLMRAYMHGYFMDVRLYQKAKNLAQPYSFEEYQKKKIKEKLAEERTNRVQLKKLPKVNQELALKLMDEAQSVAAAEVKGKTAKTGKTLSSNLLQDSRFKALFENTDFEVDKTADAYKLLNPAVSRLDKQREKELRKQVAAQEAELSDEEKDEEGNGSDSLHSASSSDDEEFARQMRKQHKLVKHEGFVERRAEVARAREAREAKRSETRLYELAPGKEFSSVLRPGQEERGATQKKRLAKTALGERVEIEGADVEKITNSFGSKEMTFTLKQSDRFAKARVEADKHHKERLAVRRSAKGLAKKLPKRLR